MTNTCELLINVVIRNKPKVLTGLNQKGAWFGSETSYFSDADQTTTGEEAASNPSRYPHGTWKTRISPNSGYISCKGDGRGGGYRRMEKAKATL